jgi:proton glutamate symport protein
LKTTARFRLSLTFWIFAALVIGVGLGAFFPHFAVRLEPISDIFLRLIKLIVGPLLFGTLIYGIASSGELKTIALVVGLTVANLARPGEGMSFSTAVAFAPSAQKPLSFIQILEHAVPTNIFEAMASNNVLQMVVFFFLFGAACAAIGAKARPVVEFAGSVAEVMFRFTRYVMYVAPFGVGAAIAVTIGRNGLKVLGGLGKLVGSLYLAQIIFVVVVLGSILILFRIPVPRFWRAARQPFLLAFSTASSEAALPLALENMERFGVPKHIVGFVLPTGYSFNLDGSTLYLALASLFVAQMAGVHLSLSTQIVMMLTLMLTSKGVAAVPRASLIILAGTLQAFGLPAEGIAVILGVDALMDMCRTSVNLLGNCVASAVVARWEGVEFSATGPEVEVMTEA